MIRPISAGAIASLVLCGLGIFLAWYAADAVSRAPSGVAAAAAFVVYVPIVAGVWLIALVVGIVAAFRRFNRRPLPWFCLFAVLANVFAPTAAYFEFFWWPTQRSFVSAAERGDRRIVERSLRAGLPINAPAVGVFGFGGIDRGETPLAGAAIAGQKDIADLLLAHGADANGPDGYGNYPLALAMEHGNSEVAQLLIARGADVNRQFHAFDHGDVEATPFQAAIWLGDLPTARELLRHGAKVNAPPAILDALQLRQHDIALLLAQNGADGYATNGGGESAITVATSMGYGDVVRALSAKANFPPDARDQFYAAVAENDQTKAMRILDAHPELLGADSTDLLSAAALAKMEDLAARLSPASHCDDYSVLQSAAKSGDPAILAMVSGGTPRIWSAVLMDAAIGGNLVEAQAAISQGAVVNAMIDNPQQGERTPLYAAAEAGNVEIIKLLLAHGANIDLGTDHAWGPKSHATYTPLDAAIRRQQIQAARLLVANHAHGRDPRADGNSGAMAKAGILTAADYHRVYGP
jgi:ankyrin repeat protein